MMPFALVMLVAAVVLAWLGGPVGWFFAVVYGLAGIDLLWFCLQLRHYRRQDQQRGRCS